MKNIRDIPDLKYKKSLRLGFVLLSTPLVISRTRLFQRDRGIEGEVRGSVHG